MLIDGGDWMTKAVLKSGAAALLVLAAAGSADAQSPATKHILAFAPQPLIGYAAFDHVGYVVTVPERATRGLVVRAHRD